MEKYFVFKIGQFKRKTEEPENIGMKYVRKKRERKKQRKMKNGNGNIST